MRNISAVVTREPTAAADSALTLRDRIQKGGKKGGLAGMTRSTSRIESGERAKEESARVLSRDGNEDSRKRADRARRYEKARAYVARARKARDCGT